MAVPYDWLKLLLSLHFSKSDCRKHVLNALNYPVNRSMWLFINIEQYIQYSLHLLSSSRTLEARHSWGHKDGFLQQLIETFVTHTRCMLCFSGKNIRANKNSAVDSLRMSVSTEHTLPLLSTPHITALSLRLCWHRGSAQIFLTCISNSSSANNEGLKLSIWITWGGYKIWLQMECPGRTTSILHCH